MYPTIEGVKGVVFALTGASTSGPDGFTSISYQGCWDIVGKDIYNMLLVFFGGASLPKSITYTKFVQLPKKIFQN